MLTFSEHPDALRTPAVPLLADRALSYELCLYSHHMVQARRGLCDPIALGSPFTHALPLAPLPDGAGEP